MIYESGAISPNNIHCLDLAEKMYSQIRRRKTDFINVAKNTGLSVEQCRIVKNYIFYDEHELKEGYIRFTPDIAMAQSWQRLAEKNGNNILQHDYMLVKHELTEIKYLLIYTKMTQREAHNRAEADGYSYSEAVKLYYRSIGFNI